MKETPARVLIVDDSPVIRKALKAILEKVGCEVAGEAGDGVEAVKLFRELNPDLVTLDMVMPLLGGVEALRMIKEISPQARVVMASAGAPRL